MSDRPSMSLGRKWALEIAAFSVIALSLGGWIWFLLDERDALRAEIDEELMPRLETDRKKISQIPEEEDRRSELEVRRNELAVAIPVYGDQQTPDLIEILDTMQKNIETSENSEAFPLLVIRDWGYNEVVVKTTSKKSRSKSKSKTAPQALKPLRVRLEVVSTYVGLLRFIDLVEKDRQLLRLVSLNTDLGESAPGDGLAPPSVPGASPLGDNRYATTNLVVEGWYLDPAGISK